MVITRQEEVQAEKGSFAAFVALPDKGFGPGLLLFQEIFGVNDFIQSKAADLAALGYVVLAPDVFWRVRPGMALSHDEAALAEAFEVMGRYAEEVPQETKTADCLAALAHLREMPEVTGGVGAVGYCLGGSLAYFVAVAGEPDAVVSYYGSMVPSSLDRAGDIGCPILFHFGDSDPYLPMDQVESVKSAFAGRSDAQVIIQPQAGHAFENLMAPQFANPEAAARSWEATVNFLGKYLPAS